eukprot:CAMPEP_0171517320 /NCGR_PEP_ID=MMETSP0959-20130129/4599_1 /TAXON_ID=87120 /ORGANISM="Aurantiochytrium limacinum, Strain ATCCMYA-1381" /LENGTH=140 /DNA_ID=CAMNT_0012056273 /DNA_START=392 /DNA_END=815 /DNA_ORIENTATION=+
MFLRTDLQERRPENTLLPEKERSQLQATIAVFPSTAGRLESESSSSRKEQGPNVTHRMPWYSDRQGLENNNLFTKAYEAIIGEKNDWALRTLIESFVFISDAAISRAGTFAAVYLWRVSSPGSNPDQAKRALSPEKELYR